MCFFKLFAISLDICTATNTILHTDTQFKPACFKDKQSSYISAQSSTVAQKVETVKCIFDNKILNQVAFILKTAQAHLFANDTWIFF